MRIFAAVAVALLASQSPAWAQSAYEFKQRINTLQVGAVAPASPAPGLQLSSSALNFGSVATNTTVSRQLLATNSGTGTLSWSASPVVSGDLAFAAGSTSCADTLAIGDSCLVEVLFSPTETGSFTGALALASNLSNPLREVPLQGSAFNPVSLVNATLPSGLVGQLYSYDFKTVLNVSNETSPDKALATWSGSGTLPAGLTFNTSTGLLSGTPEAPSAGVSYTVTATYKKNTGQRVYTLVVGDVVLQVTQISVGANHTCAVTTQGGAVCWGLNDNGQLGDGTTTSRRTPVAVYGLTAGVANISAGRLHTCAVTTTGGTKCWGSNTDARLGDGTTTQRLTPVDVSGLSSGVASVAAGGRHTCVLTTAGGAKCWGDNTSGQVGYSSTITTRATPVDVSRLTAGVAAIAVGNSHSCAITTGGAAKCWGHNGNGQLGNNSTANRTSEITVTGLSAGVSGITGGWASTCAVLSSGAAKCWGSNGNGVLGDGTATQRLTPVDVSGLTSGASSISMGTNQTCAATSTGLKCWGKNTEGQLGNGTVTDSRTPVGTVSLGASLVAVSSGSSHVCALLAGNTAKCWGRNAEGQLGDGTTTQRNTPVPVSK